jgi:predicted SnoaL-like aldol condensation-catalyzing enzyme
LSSERKDKIIALLKSIETGEVSAVQVVNETKYIQHNPQTKEGGEGLAELFKRLSKSSPTVNVVRIFSDGDYVFGHMEYDFGSPRVGFEVFRFEKEQAVEHWDNIQPRKGPNLSGHTMVDGDKIPREIESTESNRALIRNMVNDVLINSELGRLVDYVSESYIEHNPELSDGISNLKCELEKSLSHKKLGTCYEKLHRVLAEGNFVLSVCEGYKGSDHCSLYDLYRVEGGKIVEHWDTVEKVPPRSEWKNENGKF